MRNRVRTVVVGLFLTGLLAACAPLFPSGAALTTTPLGPLVTLSWPAATPDADKTVDAYGIEIDGVEIARAPGGATSCVLTGLARSTTYALAVTAYDSTGAWSGNLSGDLASLGRVSGSVTTGTRAGAGNAKGCVPPTDTDGDRLPDAVETDSGVYFSAARTGTDPAVADTDGDGISDGDETLGTAAGLDLRALGTRPVKKDLLFEYDWFDDSLECGSHSHRPTAGSITRLANAFAAAPVANPDGTTGINVISDYGQGGAFTGGGAIADADGVIANGVSGSDFLGYKASRFSPLREGYFHYVLMPHRYNTTSGSSGQAEVYGDDLIVSLQCYNSDSNIANTIMHEVGHNLGLRHGGDVDVNNKPNYNSVMNYRYQFPGVDTNCNVAGDGVLDFSAGARASLDENALSEAAGVCGGVALDWNGNSLLDAGTVAVDVNADTTRTVLHDHDDWDFIWMAAVRDLDGAPAVTEIITEQPVPESHRHGG